MVNKVLVIVKTCKVILLRSTFTYDLLSFQYKVGTKRKKEAVELQRLFDEFGFNFVVLMRTETWYIEETDILKLSSYFLFI